MIEDNSLLTTSWRDGSFVPRKVNRERVVWTKDLNTGVLVMESVQDGA